MSLAIALLAVSGAFAQGNDHAPFDALLRASVAKGDVDHPAFQDSAPFEGYVASLAKDATLPTRADQLAYNVDACNALAIQGILDGLSHWPLAGRRISLHDLEHKVLRPLGDPRIRVAIICASRSCPSLRSEAYAPATLDAQLDDQARRFVNDPFRNGFDKATKTAQLSEIFEGFEEDFRGAGSVQKCIARCVGDPEVAKDLAQDGDRIQHIDHGWTLDGTPPRR